MKARRGKFGTSNVSEMSDEVKLLEARLKALKDDVERHQNMLVRKSDGLDQVRYLNDFVNRLQDRVRELEKLDRKVLEAQLKASKDDVERQERVRYLNDFVGRLEDRVRELEKLTERIDSEVVRAHHRCDRIPPERGYQDFNLPDTINFVLIVILGLTLATRL